MVSKVAIGPCAKTYQYLIPKWRTMYTLTMSGQDFHLISYDSRYWLKYGKLERPVKYSGVLPTYKTVWNSILKMDVPVIKNPNPKCWEDAKEKVSRALESLFTQTVEPFPEFVTKTACGFPFNKMGTYKTKREVLNADFWQEYVDNPFDKISWWRPVPKYEYLSLTEIKELKIRTFIPSPMHVLYQQKRFFSKQDTQLKEKHPLGIRYGISFQYGGFDDMIKAHYRHHGLHFERDLEKLLFVEADVSSWDRRLPIMREIYDIREEYLQVTEKENKYLQWTIENTLNSLLLLPNGDVVQKIGCSNNSGSGCTTSDNCLGHALINEYNDLMLRADSHTDIYGDDLLKSYPIKYEEELKDGNHFRKVYGDFNLIIKESAFKIRRGCVGATFLGATVVKVKEWFLPAYNSERIYAALVKNIEDPQRNVDHELAKAYSLLLLSWNDKELFHGIRNYILTILAHERGGYVDTVRDGGVPTRKDVKYCFWLQTERKVNKRMEEGFKRISEESSFRQIIYNEYEYEATEQPGQNRPKET